MQTSFDYLRERNKELRRRMRRRDIGPFLLELWTHSSGIRCGIGKILRGGCGYVQLPKPLAGRWKWYPDVPVECHYGLSYGVDREGWIGFDTAHAGDYWPRDELAQFLSVEEQIENDRLRELAPSLYDRPTESYGIEWNWVRLRGEVNHLAQQVKVLSDEWNRMRGAST